ncbi:MAG TPA: outer membrane beta-barrel protein [Burkholderiales bacterium]|nr:outer membrane beta-barrel protein [Burkholderiales bacterium]
MSASLAAGQQAGGATHPALQDRWSLSVGLYTPNVETTARLNGSGGLLGTEVSFEDDLGYADREDMPAILASVRLGERWKIEAEYLSLRRENSHVLSRTISWGDGTYTVGTTVSSEFSSDIFRLSAGYSFIKDARKEVGVVLGLHVTDFTMAIAASGIGSDTGEALAPLPTLGIYGAYAFTPKWLLSGRVDVFSLEYEEYDGSLTNVTVGVDYRLLRNLGLGAAYRYIDYDLNVTKSSLNGGINYRFSGPLLYLVSSF